MEYDNEDYKYTVLPININSNVVTPDGRGIVKKIETLDNAEDRYGVLLDSLDLRKNYPNNLKYFWKRELVVI